MSTSSITVSADTFKPVDIKVTVTTKEDLKALSLAIRHGVTVLPEENTFVTDLSKKLQCI
jgi:hypothetical protein